jgi:hypothetical protein
MKKLPALLLVIFCTPVWSAETRIREPAITQLLSGKSLYANTETEQMFHPDGVTFYMEHGNVSQGTWKIVNDQYCSSWPPNPALVCYDVMTDGQLVVFVGKSGNRSVLRISK